MAIMRMRKVGSLWSAILLLAISCVSNASHFHVPNSLSNQTDPTDQEAAHLGQVKLGLAAAFFFTVLIACGLPVVLVNCVKKSQIRSQTLPITVDSTGGPSSDTRTHTEYQHYNPAFNASKHLAEIPPPRGDTPADHIDWDGSPTRVARVSVDSEPLSSPGPNHAETTDLLTGRPISGTGVWPLTRRDRTGASGTLRRATPDRRACQLQNGSVGSKRLLQARSSIARKASLRIWFSRCNCCAAGIFLSSGFMELYVDVEESINHAKTSLAVDSHFPFAPFLTLLGFFLVLAIEQIVWSVRTYRLRSLARAAAATARRRRQSSIPAPESSCVTTPVSPPAQTTNTSHTVFSFFGEPTTPTATREVATQSYEDDGDEYPDPHSSHGHSHHFAPVDSLDSFESVLRVAVLLVAMSVHSLFEGLAVGLQSTVAQTLALFSAILLHKLIIAVGIGMNLATVVVPSSPSTGEDEDGSQWGAGSASAGEKNLSTTSTIPDPDIQPSGVAFASPERRTDRKTMFYQAAFTVTLAIASPLGVLIGWALASQHQSPVLLMVTAVLQGLACGTFFYVVFCELLPEEFRGHTGDRMGKLTFLIFGFFLVCIYSLLMPH